MPIMLAICIACFNQLSGINAIYLNPIFQSASNHRYHTHDYFKVDPLLGGDDAVGLAVVVAGTRKNRYVRIDIEKLLVEERKNTQQLTMPSKPEWETPHKNAKLEPAAQRLT